MVLDRPTNNWVSMGEYQFTQRTAVVEMTDESKGEHVFADAVKWVKKDSSSR